MLPHQLVVTALVSFLVETCKGDECAGRKVTSFGGDRTHGIVLSPGPRRLSRDVSGKGEKNRLAPAQLGHRPSQDAKEYRSPASSANYSAFVQLPREDGLQGWKR